MWARRRLRVVLDRENRVLPVLHSFTLSVVEVMVRDLKRLRAGYASRLSPHRESVVLRRDKYLSRRKIAHWMVPAPMPIRQLHRFPSEGQTQQLVAQADAKNRNAAVGEVPDRGDGVADGGGVARAVRQEDTVGSEVPDRRGRRRRGDDRHATSLLDEEPQDVALHPVVERDDVMSRVRGSFRVRVWNRRRAGEIESVHRR